MTAPSKDVEDSLKINFSLQQQLPEWVPHLCLNGENSRGCDTNSMMAVLDTNTNEDRYPTQTCFKASSTKCGSVPRGNPRIFFFYAADVLHRPRPSHIKLVSDDRSITVAFRKARVGPRNELLGQTPPSWWPRRALSHKPAMKEATRASPDTQAGLSRAGLSFQSSST